MVATGSGKFMGEKALQVTVVGGTGYTGAELLRLLVQHPDADIAAVCGQRTAGKALSESLPALAGVLDLQVQAFDAAKVAANSDAVFCALPHAASAKIVSELREHGVVVLDLSADFRFDDRATYETWYGQHPKPERLAESVYGLVELHRARLKDADLIAVPGCYPTAATLALAPLIGDKLIKLQGIVVDAKSGVSGAGRDATASTHYPEVAESIRAYKAGAHRHAPEIEKEISAIAGQPVLVTFVPHLVPMTRGILACSYGTPSGSHVDADVCTQAARAFYEGSPFVHVHDAGMHPDTLWVRGSNRAHIAYHQDERTKKVIAMSVIDNLVKGAAGQAIQCFNIRFGFEEGRGLGNSALWP